MGTWMLMDSDNPYRLVYYGGHYQDPKLPLVTLDFKKAFQFNRLGDAEKSSKQVYEETKGFYSVIPVREEAYRPFPCPVCLQSTFEEEGDFADCPVCRWENDALQGYDHNFWGGANELSVNEARLEFFLMSHPLVSLQAKAVKLQFDTMERSLLMRMGEIDIDADKASYDALRDEHLACRTGYMNKLTQVLLSLLGIMPEGTIDLKPPPELLLRWLSRD